MTQNSQGLGVRARLLAAFLGISALAVVGAMAALWAFAEVGKTVDQVTRERMPAVLDALELARQAERIGSTAPKLLAHRGANEQMRTDGDLRSALFRLEQLLVNLKAQISEAPFSEIEKAVGEIRRNLAELQSLFRDPFSTRDLTAKDLGMANQLLADNSEISRRLTAAVGRFVSDERAQIAQASASVATTQNRGLIVIVVSTALSLVGGALIVWLYVQRSIVRRLTALSNSMLAIARGNLQASLPANSKNDEIGLMAEALRIFRDTAILNERFGRLKRFLAPQVAELIISAGDEKVLNSHRRDIAVLFCDLRGFTAFAEAAQPEEVMEMLRNYHESLGPLVHKFAGTLERFTGDGLIVLFNDPLPCQDPCLTAARLAIEMRRSAKELVRRHQLESRLGFGIGIAYGYATLGRIGFEGRSDYTAIGSVVNLAARLCERAKADEILIDRKVHDEIDRFIQTDALGDFIPKGFSRPVEVFNVVAGKREITAVFPAQWDPKLGIHVT